MNLIKTMRISFLLTLISSLLLQGVGVAAENPVVQQSTGTKNMIVCFKNAVDDMSVLKVGGKIHRKYRNLSIAKIEVTDAEIANLKKNRNISCLDEDVKFQTAAQSPDWGIDKVKAPKAWSGGFTGKGIKVAIIDTGISTHEDLVVSGGASFVDYTTSYEDDYGHGTHVAGIIGARNNDIGVVGVAPEASLYAVKVLDNFGSGSLSGVVAGIDWAITNGMNVINMSLGSWTGTTSMEQAVDQAYNSGILVVAAAGNAGTADGLGDSVSYPARYDSAIAVAAVDSNLNRASFSSTGNKVEIAAPGDMILSTYMGNTYEYLSGTSMATPYVSGLLALLKQANPTLTAPELRAKLQQTAIDLGDPGRDALYGYGLIQAPTINETPIPSNTPIVTASPSPSATPIVTVSPSPSMTPVVTVKPSPSATPIVTVKPSPSTTPIVTYSPAPSTTPIVTASPSPSATPIVTVKPSPSTTPIVTYSPTPSTTPVVTVKPSPSTTPIVTYSPTPSTTPIVTYSPTPSMTPIVTYSPKPTATPIVTYSPKPSTTPIVTNSPKPSTTPIVTYSPMPSTTPIVTPIKPSPSTTPIVTYSPTPSMTPIVTYSPKPSATPIVTYSPAPSMTPIVTYSPMPSTTPIVTYSPIPSTTPIVTYSPKPSTTPIVTYSPTPSATPIVTYSPAPSMTPIVTYSPKPSTTPIVTYSPMPSTTPIVTYSPKPSTTPIVTYSPNPSATPIVTYSPAPSTTPIVTYSPTPSMTPIVTYSPKPSMTPIVTYSPKPSEQPVLQTIVWVKKSTYNRGDKVQFKVYVMSSNVPIENAIVNVSVIDPNGQIVIGSGRTSSNGSMDFIYWSSKQNPRGLYTITSTSEKSGYVSTQGSSSFVLRKD